jgi:hypothetical protein
MKTIQGQYAASGYQIFRGALPVDAVNALASAARMVPAYKGEVRRISGRMERNNDYLKTGLIMNAVSNAHLGVPEELAPVLDAMVRLVTSESLWRCLHALDGAEHYTLHQSLLFLISPSTDLHIDSWAVDSFPLGYAHSVWIPLQAMERISGTPSVVPWPAGKVLSEEDLGLPAGAGYDRYHVALEAKILATTPDVVTAFFRPGDVFVWSSATPHCTMPAIPTVRERLALQLMMRPSHMLCGKLGVIEGWQENAERVNDHFSFLRVTY